MLTIHSHQRSGKTCDGISRRHFLKLGSLCVGGLTLADLLRSQSHAASRSPKSVIMVWLEGGPSHIDTYDLKPNAPAEIRGPFKPIQTSVPGFDMCDLLPEQAKIADQLAIIRNMAFQNNDHRPPEELLTGFQAAGRPALGSVVSRLQADAGGARLLPPYVQLDSLHDPAERLSFPAYLGAAHKPFVPGKSLKTLELSPEVSAERLSDRRQLLSAFDTLNRNLDGPAGNMVSMDAFTAQAMEMIRSPQARDAFDISREPQSIRARYGPATQLLQARRLVEAGVKVVSVSFVGVAQGRKEACGFGGGTWDTHGNLDKCLGHLLPQLDRAVAALATDLQERGLDKDVAVVFWGEMGREPRITPNPGRTPGRGHWPQAGFALMLGGGLKMGQVVGATDSKGANPTSRPYTPQNVLATLYHVLGIDPAMTFPDHMGRPMYLLDDRRPIEELI
ncbi:hypothetical protein AYO44_05465 [Planctomycetaceae bacterium SCGC AG-212-F19]|nr:hypothetical protein AYO44_05465 [Planctomycetaceae bacterium SCGC AG-212-F19]